MSDYKHKPLLHPDTFRLLLLQPSNFHDDELNGSLLETSFADCDYDLIDKYTALSYVWGSAEKPCYIRLDGNVLTITQSLNNALRDIRDATRASRVWADALCIDQNNIPERNSQVKLMGRIYSGASSTIIYLGNLTPEAAEVFAAAPREFCNIASDLGGKEIDDMIEFAARDLLSRPWFKRVWVFQELVLSRDPWVQCGRTRVRWTDLCRLLLPDADDELSQSGATESVASESVVSQSVASESVASQSGKKPPGTMKTKLGLLEDMATGRTQKKAFSLLEALIARRGLGATDARDFVFANLSIVFDAPLVADYSKSTQWVFSQLGPYVFNKLGLWGLVNYIDDISPDEKVEGMPSWAPDWTHAAPDWTHASSGLVPFPDPYHEEEYSVGEFRGFRSPRDMWRVGPWCTTPHSFTGGDLPVVLGLPGSEYGVVEATSGVIPLEPGDTAAEVISGSDSESDSGSNSGLDYQEKQLYRAYRKLKRQASVWAQFFSGLEKPPVGEASENDEFVSLFCQWVSDMYKHRDLFEYHNDSDDNNEKSYSLDLVSDYFLCPDTENPLRGRRLAMTSGPNCCIVPTQTRKGDIIGCLMPSGILVVLRRVERLQEEEIRDAIVQGLRGEQIDEEWIDPEEWINPGVVDYDDHGCPIGRQQWSVPKEGDVTCVDVGHYIVIGGCYINCVGGSHVGYNGYVKVFALH